MDEQTEERMNELTDKQTNKQMKNGRTTDFFTKERSIFLSFKRFELLGHFAVLLQVQFL